MKLTPILRRLTVALCLALTCTVFAQGDSEEYSKGEILYLNPSSLHPTQFLYSKLEVDHKVQELKKMMDQGGTQGVKQLLDDKMGEVVVGPENKMWLVDGHHEARALEIVRKTDPRFEKILFVVEVRNEWNELTSGEFEAAMKAGNKKLKPGKPSYVYLKDRNGRLQNFKKLPKQLSSMKDFPWRSLVWMLKERGVIETSDPIPFQEFFLAEELRKKIPLSSKMTHASYEKAFEQAVEVVGKFDDDKLFGFEIISETDCARILKRANH